MSTLPVPVQGTLTLVPSKSLPDKLRKAAQSGVSPPEPVAAIAVLNSFRNGVPALIEPSQDDLKLVLYTKTFVMQLFPNDKSGCYSIGYIEGATIRSQAKLAGGCLNVKPQQWRLASTHQSSTSHWKLINKKWEELAAQPKPPKTVPAPRRHTEFLDRLCQVVKATRRIRRELRPADASSTYAYSSVQPVGDTRYGAGIEYGFTVREPLPERGTYVKVRGNDRMRGRVVAIDGRRVVVRFTAEDKPDFHSIPQQGFVEESQNETAYWTQREALDLVRTGRSVNKQLLDTVVDKAVSRIPTSTLTTNTQLDDDPGQLGAFRAGVSADDTVVIHGPPGTGKTRTISAIATEVARTGQRVLLTSHTNRAVDNMAPKVNRDGLIVLRIGQRGSVTADAEPFLLQVRARDLRDGSVGRVDYSLECYDRLRTIEGWVQRLGQCLDKHANAQSRLVKARSDLREAAQPFIDKPRRAMVEAESELREGRAAKTWLVQRRFRLMKRLRHAESAWRPVRLILGPWARRLQRRINDVMGAIQIWYSSIEDLTERSHRAAQKVETILDDEPELAPYRAAVAQWVGEQDRCYAEAEAAAVAALKLVRPIDRSAASLGPMESGGPDAARRDVLSETHAWLQKRTPLWIRRAELLREWRSELDASSDQFHPELVRHAHIICATCIGSGSNKDLSDIEFDLVILDEAGQIGVADALVPLAKSRRAVLVGDHMQLPPFQEHEVAAWARAAESGIRNLVLSSLLEYLIDDMPDSHVKRLTIQRRMPKVVADFASDQFYDGRLSTQTRHHVGDPLFNSPLAFIDTVAQRDRGEKHMGGTKGKIVNPLELGLLTALARYYEQLDDDWAVIVAYRAQLDAVVDDLSKVMSREYASLNVGTVDAFQGGERDMILYGFTRSNPRREVGFLTELKRLNVALTRAKRQLVLVGDSETLTGARNERFREFATALLSYVAARGDRRDYARVVADLNQKGLLCLSWTRSRHSGMSPMWIT